MIPTDPKERYYEEKYYLLVADYNKLLRQHEKAMERLKVASEMMLYMEVNLDGLSDEEVEEFRAVRQRYWAAYSK